MTKRGKNTSGFLLTPLSDVLDKTLNKPGLKKAFRENKVLFVWNRAVGESIAANAKPIFIKDGVMTVETRNHAWSQELSLISGKILDAINEAIGKKVISALRFQLAEGEFTPLVSEEEEPRKSSLGQEELDPEIEQEIDSMLSSIEDADYKEALRNLMRRGANLEKTKALRK